MAEEYTTEQATKEIEAIIKRICPRAPYLDFVEEMVEHYEKMNNAPEPLFWFNYKENVEVDKLNDAAKRLEYDLLENSMRVSKITKYEPKNDFEDGVCNSIGYLHMIIHHMNPS